MKKLIMLVGSFLVPVVEAAEKPTAYIERVIDELTNMLMDVVFKGALLVMVVAAVYYLIGIDPEKRETAKRAFWYAILAIVIVKTAPLLIAWLKNV